MKKTSPDIKEYVEDIKKIFPEDKNLEDMRDWEDLWVYLSEVLRVKIWKHQVVKDILGLYRRSYLLSSKGWTLKEIGEYRESAHECLMYVNNKYCIYEYID